MLKKTIVLGVSTVIFLFAIMTLNICIFQDAVPDDFLNSEFIWKILKICALETVMALTFVNVAEHWFNSDIFLTTEKQSNKEDS